MVREKTSVVSHHQAVDDVWRAIYGRNMEPGLTYGYGHAECVPGATGFGLPSVHIIG